MSYIIDRKLPQKTFLRFYFPSETGGNPSTVTLPFYENPTIKEDKRAKYKKYNLISRSSQLYGYMGADSRRFSLDFPISLVHLEAEHPEVSIENYKTDVPDTTQNLAELRELFLEGPKTTSDKSTGNAQTLQTKFQTIQNLHDSVLQVLYSRSGSTALKPSEVAYVKALYGITGEDIEPNGFVNAIFKPLSIVADGVEAVGDAVGGALNGAGEFLGNLFGDEEEENTDTEEAPTPLPESGVRKLKIINSIMYWLNIIRCSVTNNSENPFLGPPIIRLHHGLMYQNVPCICTNYSISWDEAAGYDLMTLLPRKIQVSMNLEEIRTGDFKGFNPEDIIGRDSLGGWEAIIGGTTTSLDPGWLGAPQNTGPPQPDGSF